MEKQTQSQAQSMDVTKQANFDCSSWSVDNSKFVPPSNLTFTDLSEMMMNMQASPVPGVPAGGSMKSMCDSIQDAAAKAACMQYSQ